jgi:hypothetical protein
MKRPVVWALGLFGAVFCAPLHDSRAQTGAPQPPVLTAFRINGGADTVSATSATLTLAHTVIGTTPTEYRVSRRSDFAGARWLPYAPTLGIQDWYDEAGEACGRRRGSHRVTLYLQMRASVGEEVRIVDGQRQLVPARVESNVLRASICALALGE